MAVIRSKSGALLKKAHQRINAIPNNTPAITLVWEMSGKINGRMYLITH
jgi:hypothetical protein